MRAEPDGLDHAANGASLNQLASLDCCAVLEALAVTHRVDALCLGLRAARLGQLLQRGEAGLVGHEVFAVSHGADAERRALARDAGGDDQVNCWVFQNFCFAARPPGLRKGLSERGSQLRLRRIERRQARPCSQQGFDLAVDVAVVDADDGEVNHAVFSRIASANPKPGPRRYARQPSLSMRTTICWRNCASLADEAATTCAGMQ